MLNVLSALLSEWAAHQATLPPEQAKQLKDERRAKWKEEEIHRKNLEVAEAGRARNFWGN